MPDITEHTGFNRLPRWAREQIKALIRERDDLRGLLDAAEAITRDTTEGWDSRNKPKLGTVVIERHSRDADTFRARYHRITLPDRRVIFTLNDGSQISVRHDGHEVVIADYPGSTAATMAVLPQVSNAVSIRSVQR